MYESNYSFYTAQVWDEIYKNRVDDIKFYVDFACRNNCISVLELGCGTGRISIPLAKSGMNVVGCDSSENMLTIARNKAKNLPNEIQSNINFVQSDMRTLDYPKKFDLVILPFNTLNLFILPKDQKNILHVVRKHLANNGKFVFDIQNPERGRYIDRFSASNLLRPSGREWVNPASGNRVIEWFSRTYNTAEQTMHEIQIWEELDGENTVVKRIYRDRWNRYTFRYEVEYLLMLMGFGINNSFGGFNQEPVDSCSEQLIFITENK